MKKKLFQHINRLLQRSNLLLYCFFAIQFTVNGQIQYTSQSVLSNGDFYKISIQETGICKIDRTFLENIGIDADNAPLDKLSIWGNGGGMLSESAGAVRPDDLLENSIKVVDQNNNNRMDDDDYVLFYAEAPHRWVLNTNNRYSFENHYYSNKNHYFLTFDKGEGKRVANSNSEDNYEFETNAYDALRVNEEEKVNPMQSGREWFGDAMAPSSQKIVDFNFPHIISGSEIEISVRCLASRNEFASRFDIYANNELLSNINITFSTSELAAEPDVAPFGELNSIYRKVNGTENLSLNFQFSSNSSSPRGYVDYAYLEAPCDLNFSENTLSSGSLVFSNKETLGKAGVRYNVSNLPNNLQIWEINAQGNHTIKSIKQNSYFVSQSNNGLQKFIAFNETAFVEAEFEEKIVNQNLHAEVFPDFVIVTHADFMVAAEELANFHRTEDGMNVLIVDVNAVYNEFSTGNADISAIRNFMKMFYDRAKRLNDDSKLPENLLLLGNATFDYKNISLTADLNTNFVPTFESHESIIGSSTFCTDDYYAFLDDDEGVNIIPNNKNIDLDIGVGRFPVSTNSQAMDMVNKVKNYKSLSSKGAWLNNVSFISDDGNGNLHFDHAEIHADNVQNRAPHYNINKIHSDAYPQVSSSGGSTYPAVTTAINNQVFTGAFMINFTGHGGENGWTDERILTSEDIRAWNNFDKLPVFVTATCSFTRYDRTQSTSAGEWLVLNPNGGAIALMTTVRVVYANRNLTLNTAFIDAAFDFSDGILTIGEIARRAKNSITQNENLRKFALMGNPALKLNYPDYKIETTQIVNESLSTENDTIKALEQITISGKVVDVNGAFLPNFNGTITPVVYDKVETLHTLGNNPPLGWDGVGNCPGGTEKETSCEWEYDLQKSVIFKGNASVENGEFQFSFIVPKDIAYNFGKGKISYFAVNENGKMASGYDDNIIIGGINENAPADNNGPQVNVYLNDNSFVYGGMVDENPLLVVELKDENGINTVGRGIGHDLTALLNDNQQNTIILNNYYESDLNNFREGTVSYPLEKLEQGRHNIRIKAWDILNNSGEGYTEFVVADSEEFALEHVLNYPNPFTTSTSFWFEHNRTGDALDVRVQVYTVSGRLVKTLTAQIPSANTRITELNWDGLDDYGNKLGRGAYVYQLYVKTSDGQTANKIEKLVILK